VLYLGDLSKLTNVKTHSTVKPSDMSVTLRFPAVAMFEFAVISHIICVSVYYQCPYSI
jgi:hypothetical protein